MTHSKKLKFIITLFILTFIITLGFYTLSVKADTGDTETPAPVEEVTDSETEDTEEIVEPTSFLYHLKDLKWEEAESIIGWVLGYVSVDFLLKVVAAIIIIIFRLKNDEKIKILKEAAIQAEIEHQHQKEALQIEYNSKLDSIQTSVNAFIKEQTDKIESLSNDKTKAIAEELKQVTDLLK